MIPVILSRRLAIFAAAFVLVVQDFKYLLHVSTLFMRDAALPLVQTNVVESPRQPWETAEGPVTPAHNFNKSHYYRLDQVLPIQWSKTHFLRTVPDANRFPPYTMENYTEVLKQPSPDVYQWEFNPSIVPLPIDQVPESLRSQDGDNQEKYYFAVYRMANTPMCLDSERGDGNVIFRRGDRGPYGYTILDSNLDIVKEAIFKEPGEDYKLYRQGNQMFLLEGVGFRKVFLNKPSDIRTKELTPFSKGDFSLYIGEETYCCKSQFCKGKNFNMFEDMDGNWMVQTNPFSPRLVESMPWQGDSVNHECKERTELSPITEKTINDQPNNSTYLLYKSDVVPEPSFLTSDYKYLKIDHNFPAIPYSEERGTACCVRIPNAMSEDSEERKRSDFLLVGLSHVKTRHFWDKHKETNNVTYPIKQYASTFYAFLPYPPYTVVARTGRFCFQYNPSDPNERDHRYMPLVRKRPFHFGEDYNCPHISFATGIVEAVDDPNKIILSHGLSDAVARHSVMKKDDMVKLLFPEA